MIKTPFDIPPNSSTEHQNQVALFMWANKVERHGFEAANDPLCYTDYAYTKKTYGSDGFAPIQFMFAVPNGGLRHVATANQLRAEGVKKGVPDICFPYKTANFSGLYIEMKKGGEQKGRIDKEQVEFIDYLRNQGYDTRVCYSWYEAAQVIQQYVGEHKNG